MDDWTIDAFEAGASAFDEAVSLAPIVDRFCSGSWWVVPAWRAFGGGAPLRVARFDEGMVALMETHTALGRTWMPLEASWGLASPFAGPDLAALAERFIEVAVTPDRPWRALFLSGLKRGGPDFSLLVRRLSKRFRLGLGQPTVRCVASLEGGWDGFLGRRSAHHRKNLRQAERRIGGRLSFTWDHSTAPEAVPALLEAVLTIERTSWKSREGHGIAQGAMLDFYTDMLPRLARAGTLRLTRAWVDGEARGYVLGGVHGDTYRGLQISFDADLEGLSLGNLMQAETVRRLCAEGIAAYDLGTDMAYKHAWAEQQIESVPLVVR